MLRWWSAVPAALLTLLLTAPSAAAGGHSRAITWHGTQVKAYGAEAAGRYGNGVIVAVLDGWVDGSHPDFEGRVLPGADCVSRTCRPGQTKDRCNHGTHVAGTVASSSFGLAPQATVLPVRVLAFDAKGECTGTPTVVAAGIRWAVAHGAQVLNLSLGPDVPGLGTASQIPAAVHEAAAAGVVVIFSAGNADLPVAQAYGGDALVVAATAPDGRLASYSQHGSGVSLAAPGGEPGPHDECTQATCVTSIYPRGAYAVAAGTSMAAPHVSAVAALLLGQNPSRSRASVMHRLTATAHPLPGAGFGLVDASAALGVKATPVAKPAPARVPVVKARNHLPPTPVRTAKPPAPRPAAPATRRPQAADGGPVPASSGVPVVLAGLLIGLAGAGVLHLQRKR